MNEADVLALEKRYQEIQQRIGSGVTLVAVSKTQPTEKLKILYELGQRDFGESYAQELTQKAAELRKLGCTEIRWHFIGHLQTNKVKMILPIVHAIHTLDSERLGMEIAKRIRAAGGAPLAVFLEVNIDQEASKSGLHPDQVAELGARLRMLPELALQGLMCIPAPGYEPDLRRAFKKLRELALSAGPWAHGLRLSMGMSDDFELAVEEGATHVRIGTALFGSRS